MRTPATAPLLRVPGSSVPLLDASFLPAEEDWAVLEALHANDFADDDEDRFAGFGRRLRLIRFARRCTRRRWSHPHRSYYKERLPCCITPQCFSSLP